MGAIERFFREVSSKLYHQILHIAHDNQLVGRVWERRVCRIESGHIGTTTARTACIRDEDTSCGAEVIRQIAFVTNTKVFQVRTTSTYKCAFVLSKIRVKEECFAEVSNGYTNNQGVGRKSTVFNSVESFSHRQTH